jgi:hypothetical protein
MFSPWFSPMQQQYPARKGLYIIRHWLSESSWHMAYWNGRDWYSAGCAYDDKCSHFDLLGASRGNKRAYFWRGLNSKPANV